MAQGFGTSQEAMAAGQAHVATATEQVQANINTLRNEVTTLQGTWSGNAATAFANLHQNFEAQANKINNALRAMEQALGSNRATYAAQEEQEAANMSNFANSINES